MSSWQWRARAPGERAWLKNHRRMLAHMRSKAERMVDEAVGEEALQRARQELVHQTLRQEYLDRRAVVIHEFGGTAYTLNEQERRWNEQFRTSERPRQQLRIGSEAASAEAAAAMGTWTRMAWVSVAPEEGEAHVRDRDRATRLVSTSLMH